MLAKISLMLIVMSCSNLETPVKPRVQKEFAKGEVILAHQLLSKVFDKEMATLACVPDIDEAALLLRTLTPRMEVIQDDLEAMLDSEIEIKTLVETCDQNCTCAFIDDLLREHMVVLNKGLKATLEKKKKSKDQNSCLNFAKETFCSSDLYKELDREKEDFTFDEEIP